MRRSRGVFRLPWPRRSIRHVLMGLFCAGVVTVVGAQVWLYHTGSGVLPAEAGLAASIAVTLRLADAQPTEEIAILVNGQERIPFSQETVTVTCPNGTLLEADGTRYPQPFSVLIDAVTDEGVLLHEATEVKVNRDIKTIGRALIRMPGAS